MIVNQIDNIRSFLFVPGDRDDLFKKALSGDADAICIDLEDGVVGDAKKIARLNINKNIQLALKQNVFVFVRLNPLSDYENFKKDISALKLTPTGFVLPKIESWEESLNIDNILYDAGHIDQKLSIISMIESPTAVLNMEKEKKHKGRIFAFLLGTEDFSLASDCYPDSELIHATYLRISMIAKSIKIKCYGMPCGIAEFNNLSPFENAAKHAYHNGGNGAFAIHPKQVKIINDVFTPNEEEINWANEVIKIYEKAIKDKNSIAILNNKMIDKPIYERALQLIKKNLYKR
jgi:citrate lyase beta subunit